MHREQLTVEEYIEFYEGKKIHFLVWNTNFWEKNVFNEILYIFFIRIWNIKHEFRKKQKWALFTFCGEWEPESSHYAEWTELLNNRLQEKGGKMKGGKRIKIISPIFSSALAKILEKYALRNPESFHQSKLGVDRNLHGTYKECTTFSLDSALPDKFWLHSHLTPLNCY